MKLEAGKFYKTRDGRKAKVGYISDTEGNMLPVAGEVFEPDGGVLWYCWNREGNNGPFTSQSDLVAEWKDPPAVVYVNQFANGTWSKIHDTPEAAKAITSRVGASEYRRIAVKFVEEQPNG